MEMENKFRHHLSAQKEIIYHHHVHDQISLWRGLAFSCSLPRPQIHRSGFTQVEMIGLGLLYLLADGAVVVVMNVEGRQSHENGQWNGKVHKMMRTKMFCCCKYYALLVGAWVR